MECEFSDKKNSSVLCVDYGFVDFRCNCLFDTRGWIYQR